MHVSIPTPRCRHAVAFALLAVAVLGCNEDSADEAAQQQSADEGDSPAAAGPAAPEGPGPAEDGERKSVEDAIGSKPPAPSGDLCETAYGSMRATIDAMNKRGPKSQAAMPPKERFLTACAELPEEMQRCMGIRYHMAHQKECKAAADAVDPELKARVQKMMGKPPSAEGESASE